MYLLIQPANDALKAVDVAARINSRGLLKESTAATSGILM